MSEFEGRRGQPDQQLTKRQDVSHAAKSWYNRPHEELAAALGGFIRQRHEIFRGAVNREEIVHNKLMSEFSAHSNLPDTEASTFYFTLKLALDRDQRLPAA